MLQKLLDDELIDQIRDIFYAQLIHPILLLYFYSQDDCASCEEANLLLEEIAALSDQIELAKYNMDEDQALAQKYRIQRSPGLVVAGSDHGEVIDFGIRFAGIPSGYEFGSLIQTMIMVSRRDSGLKSEIRDELKTLKIPTHLQVFVTPT